MFILQRYFLSFLFFFKKNEWFGVFALRVFLTHMLMFWDTQDTGHRNDWEFAIVVWKRDGSSGNFIRDSVIMEQDGGRGYKLWNDLPQTYDRWVFHIFKAGCPKTLNIQLKYWQHLFGTSDIYVDLQGADHPKLYMSKWHHSIHSTPNHGFKNTCPPNSGADFRNGDYQYQASNWLSDGNTIPGEFFVFACLYLHQFTICLIPVNGQSEMAKVKY